MTDVRRVGVLGVVLLLAACPGETPREPPRERGLRLSYDGRMTGPDGAAASLDQALAAQMLRELDGRGSLDEYSRPDPLRDLAEGKLDAVLGVASIASWQNLVRLSEPYATRAVGVVCRAEDVSRY